jgi:hypothetical protein
MSIKRAVPPLLLRLGLSAEVLACGPVSVGLACQQRRSTP